MQRLSLLDALPNVRGTLNAPIGTASTACQPDPAGCRCYRRQARSLSYARRCVQRLYVGGQARSLSY